jgi:hypothetical protein
MATSRLSIGIPEQSAANPESTPAMCQVKGRRTNGQRTTRRERSLEGHMLRLRLLMLFPFLSRWLEVSPACCGMCPTCVGTAAGGLLLPMVLGEREKKSVD